jgi:hypothetical protein
MPERRIVDQALATWSPIGGFGHASLDRGLGSRDPVSHRSLIRSFTNFGVTRKCRAASRRP